jgi:hypothetical protein
LLSTFCLLLMLPPAPVAVLLDAHISAVRRLVLVTSSLRWGTVSFSINGTDSTGTMANTPTAIQLSLSADFSQPAGTNMTTTPPELNIRIRDPVGKGRTLVPTVQPGSDCGVVGVLQSAELLQVVPHQHGKDGHRKRKRDRGSIVSCRIQVDFE